MEIAHEKLRGTGTSDVGALITRLADLHLTLEKEQARKEQQSQQLLASKQDVTTLRTRLDRLKGRAHVQRVSSVRNLRSTESSNASSSEDMARMKRELAEKTEKIAALESDLDEANDQIHQLKQKKRFDQAFPATSVLSSEDDFFSDNEVDDDEFWAVHSPSKAAPF